MPVWLSEREIRAFHRELLAEHGGLEGAGDEHRLGAALARPQNLLAYGNPPPSLFQLAAAYGFAFVKDHCFPDGNKRVALASIDVFLQLNSHELNVAEAQAVYVIRQVAAGEMSEQELSHWIEERSVRLPDHE